MTSVLLRYRGGRSAVSLMAYRYQVRSPRVGPRRSACLGGLLPQAGAPIVTPGKPAAAMTVPIVFAIGGDPIAPGLVSDGSVIQPASDLGVPSEPAEAESRSRATGSRRPKKRAVSPQQSSHYRWWL